ncbi:MAG TPA: hypothetical protein PK010_04130 [Alphaproteobacteria bacterium]|nr:hypothetical protein [Alphaproteobacteria bacterium]
MIGIGVTATSLGAACLGFFLRLQTSPEFYNKCCGDPHDENSQTTKGKASHNKDLSTDEKSLIIMPPRGPHNSKKNLEEDNFSR